MPTTDLGKLKGVFGISPAVMQRAAAVSLLSFVFFLLMMGGFYWRQNMGYFLLATAFLVVNILTLLGWIAIRRRTVQVYEQGFQFKGVRAGWEDIRDVERGAYGLKINKKDGASIELPAAIDRLDAIAAIISAETARVRNGDVQGN